MDLTDSFLNIEINDLKRKENAYLYLNEQGRNISLNNMNKSGQEFTEKKKGNTLGLNQENLLLKILKNNELIWKKKEDNEKFLNKQNSINDNNHNDVNTHMCNGYLPAHVKEDGNTFLKTSYEVYNMIKYQNIDKYYKTDNLINFYNDKNILSYKKIKRKDENKNKDYIDKNYIYPNDLESNILNFEPNNFSSNYLLENFNNKLVNNYINIHNTDYIEIQDIFDENKLNHVKNKNLCFYKNVDLKKFRKNENNYMNDLMNSGKKKNTTYSHHLKENQVHTKNDQNNKSPPKEVEQNVDNLSIYERNSQVDIINNNISQNDSHDYISNNLNNDFIDEIKSDQNQIEESKNNMNDDIIDFDIDNEFHFNDESLGDKSNKNEEDTKNEQNNDEILEDDLIFSEKNSSKLSDKNDSLMDLLNNYDEPEIGDEKNKQNNITFENDNVDDLLDIEFLDEKEKVSDLKNGDEISEPISDFFFEDDDQKEKIKLEDEYCKSGDDNFIPDYELDKNNISDNMLIMNDIEEDNINDDKDDVENINNVHSQINEEHEIIKDFDLNKEKTDFYNSVVYSFDNNYNNKDNYTHLKQNNDECNIFKNIYQEYYHTINNDELKNELELFGNHIINNSYIFMLLNYKYIKNYNYNNSLYPFNSDDYTNYLFKNKNIDKNILQNENIIQEVFGTNDDIHTQGNNKLNKKIKNRSNLKHMQNLYQNPLFSDPHLLKNFNSSPMLRNKNTNGIQNGSHIINPHDINTDPNLVNQPNSHVIVDANGHINNPDNIDDTQNVDHTNANDMLDAEQNNIISNMIKHKVNYGHEENDDECSNHFNEKYEHTYNHMNNNKLLQNKKTNKLFYMDFNTYLNTDHNYINGQTDAKIYLGNFTKIMDEFKMEDIQYNEHYIFDKLNNKLLHEVEKNYYISYMLRNLFLKDKKHSDILLKCLIYKPDEYQNVGAINFHNILNETGENFRSIDKQVSILSNADEDNALTALDKMKKKNKLIEFDDSYFINNKKDRLECAENILKKTKNIIFFSHLKLDSYYKKNNPHEIENMILSYNNVYVNTQMTKDYYYSFELSNKKGVIAFSRFHKLDFRTGIHKYYHDYKKFNIKFNNDYTKLHELEDVENEDVVPWGWENLEKKYLTQKDDDLIISSYWDYIIPEVAKTHSYFNQPINKFFKLGNRQSSRSVKYLSIGNIDKYENINKYFNASNKNYYIRKTFKNIINILNNENFNFDMHILDAWTIEKAYDHSIFDEDDTNENINIDNNVNNKIDDHSSFFYNNSCLLLNDDSPLIILEYVEKDPFVLLKLGMNSKINHYFTTRDDESLYSLEYKNKLKKIIEPFGEINVIKDPINYFGVPIKIKKQDQKLTFIENELFKALLFTIPVYSMHKENEDHPIFDEPSQAIANHLDNTSQTQENGVLTNIENELNTSDPILAENQLDGHMLTNSEVENYSNAAKYEMSENNPPPNVTSSNKDSSSLFYHTDFLLIRNISNNGRKYYIKPFYVDVNMCKNVKENNVDNLNMHNYYDTSQIEKHEDQYKANNYNTVYGENINNQYREGNENYLNINYTNCIFYNVGFLDMHVSTYNPFYKKYIDEKRNYVRSWLIKLIIKHQIKDSKKIKEILKTKLNTFISDKDINAIVKSVDINFILSKEYTDERNNKNSYKSKNVCILECIYHFIQLYKYEGIDFKNILEHQDKLNKIIYLLNMEKERANNNIINIKKKMKIIYNKYCYKSEAKSIQFSLTKEDIYIDMIDNYNYVGSHFYDKNILNYFLYIKYLISCSPWNILKDYSNNLPTSKYGNNNTKQEAGRKKKGLDNKKYESLNKKKNKNKLKNAQQKLKIKKNKQQLYYDQKDNDATLSTTSNDNDATNSSYSDNDFEGYDKKYLKKKKKKDINQYRKGKMKNKQDSDIFEMSDEENKEQNQVEKKYNKKKKKEKNKGKHSLSDLTDFSFSEEDNESLDDDKHSNSSSDEKGKKKKKKIMTIIKMMS